MQMPIRHAFAAVFLLTAGPVHADNPSADPLFQDNNVLEVTLAAPLQKIIRSKSTKQYQDGRFQYLDANGNDVNLDIRVRARGNFRLANCDHPPVWLNFRKSQVKGTLFANQKKLKLVVHCSRSAYYEQLILKEYLAYRMLNLVTDQSFRVRLLRINYVDISNNRAREPRYGILIEHKERLAHRLGRTILDIPRTTPAELDAPQQNLNSVFQFFIGNTDFSQFAGPAGEACCHNTVLFAQNKAKILPVPYDFDQAGFVNASYAAPNPRLRIRTVRTRLYRGRCSNNDYLPASFQAFTSNKNAIYELIDTQPGLDRRTATYLRSYTDDFFKLIEDPDASRKQIYDKCL